MTEPSRWLPTHLSAYVRQIPSAKSRGAHSQKTGEKMASKKNSAYRATLRCDIGASGRNCDFSLRDLNLKGRRDLGCQERVKEASLRSQAPASDGVIIA